MASSNLFKRPSHMDLTQLIPRSPKNKLAGIVMIPRMLDKARAYKYKSLGEYIYPCPLDQIILGFLGIDHKKLAYQAQKLTEKEIGIWVNKILSNRSISDKENINKKLLGKKPNTKESINRFNLIRDKINPSIKHLTTWVELIELEERQITPKIL
jgi:hypothetical protein